MTTRYIRSEKIFDGETVHHNCALVINDKIVQAIIAHQDIPVTAIVEVFSGGMIIPGFVDLQVNGGGGVLFNDTPSVEAITTICAAHAKFGTSSLLPTFITDTYEKTNAAIDAAIEAQRQGLCGFIGLHLEGPHLSHKRKGAHDPALIRTMTDEDLALLVKAKTKLDTLLCTIAPESVSLEQVATMAKAGITVSLGHTDCSYQTAVDYFAAGASMVTHLFNAMSQMGNREPGLVGAALNVAGISCGLIADGFHVSNASMQIALRGQKPDGHVFLVTDAMSTVGSDIKSFTLSGQQVLRQSGRLTLSDGTLAGADIDMVACVRSAHKNLGLSQTEAIKMASLYPATAIGRGHEFGSLKPHARADFSHVSDDLEVLERVVNG